MVISVLYQNVRGLKTKTTAILKNSLNCDHKIICLTETWLNQSVLSSEIICDAYNVHRRDRETSSCIKSEGGGVLIAVDKELKSFTQDSWISEAEDLWVTVIPEENHGQKFHIGCVYIPPGDTLALNLFCSKLSDITTNNPNDVLVLCGDFNLPQIKWILHPVNNFCKPYNYTDYRSSLLIDTLSFAGLCQFNNNVNECDNTLDLILNNNCNVNNVSICTSPLVTEDRYHNTLQFDLNINYSRTKIINNKHTFNFSRADYNAINYELQQENWNILFSDSNVEENTTTFYSIINHLIDLHVPKYSKRYKKFPLWYSLSTIKVIKEKKKYHNRWKKFGNDIDKLTFNLLRGRSKYLISEDYKKFVEKSETNISSNPKYLWQFVKSKKNSTGLPNTLNKNNILITDGQGICDAFSEYFMSVFNQPTNTTPPINRQNLDPNSINIGRYHIDRQTIADKIRALPNKAAGPDNIPNSFIKHCIQGLIEPLYLIFNKSLNEGYFPKTWKMAHVVPIFKSGNKNIVENYRPISKLCIIAKLFESIIFDFLYSDVRNILNVEQHGFMKKRSVDSNLFIYTEYILKNMNSRIQVDAIYTDFSKAFDKIDHTILLEKLAGVGVYGSLLKWFDSYVTDRLQAVTIGDFTSSYTCATSGVPQGSHLGPLLFNIYINDISKCFQFSRFLMYADDLKIFHSISNNNDSLLLQNDLHSLFAYCEENKLFLNFSKCHHITFSRNINTLYTSYKLSNHKLLSVSEVKDLGITYDSKLLFNQHISNISKKANQMLGFLFRTCYEFKNLQVHRILYMSYVNSLLNFASVIWNPQYDVYINKLEGVQNKFISYINKKYFPHINNDHRFIRKNINIISLENRRQITDMKFIFKAANNLIDSVDVVNNLNYLVPSYNTRQTYLFFRHPSSTNYYLNSPLQRAIQTYNTLSQSIIPLDIFSNSLITFHNCLKSHFLNFYP